MAAKPTVKSPNDYPLFGYRLFPEIKDSLSTQLEEVLEHLNQRRPENKKPYKKNDVFVEALKLGLAELKNRKAKQ